MMPKIYITTTTTTTTTTKNQICYRKCEVKIARI